MRSEVVLPLSLEARKLSGNPPLSQSLSIAFAGTSNPSTGCISRYAMRPASVSPDCLRSMEAEPSSRNWPVRRPAAIAIDQAPQSLEHVRQTMNFVGNPRRRHLKGLDHIDPAMVFVAVPDQAAALRSKFAWMTS